MHSAVDAPIPSWPSAPPDAISVTGARLVLQHRTAMTHVPLVWLRDNCPCAECRYVEIDEHRYFLGVVDDVPTVITSSLEDDVIVLDWTDGHTSRFPYDDLLRLRRVANRSHPDIELWGDDFEPSCFEHDLVMSSATERARLLERFSATGVAILTGCPTDPGRCATIVESLGAPLRETPFDRVHDVYFSGDGYNVAHTAQALPPHTDFASYQWPPSGQILHMLRNDVPGGASLVVDGWSAAESLRLRHPEHFATLARVEVGFREHAPRAESWTRAPLLRTASNGDVAGIRFSNQLMQPLDPEDRDVDAWYAAYHELARSLADPSNHVTFRLDTGMALLVHGHRVLHGRTAYDPGAGNRHLQDTYFEFDDLRSELARITHAIPH